MERNNDSGLCIPYTVHMTPDKGRGVFAAAAIRKGTIVWCHLAGQYVVHDEHTLRKLIAKSSHSDAVYELTHIFCVAEFPGYMVRVFNDGVLINHSEQPNLATNNRAKGYKIPKIDSPQDVAEALLDSRFSLIASKDINAGDELTLDYNSDPEDPLYYETLCDEYRVSWEWL